MLAADSSPLPHDSFNHTAEELESMRHAFRRACDENPNATKTAAQQYSLAKAIVSRFQPGMSETQLIAIALRKVH